MTLSAFVADFGLAKNVATGSKYTRSGTTLGTPAYMSPELARGEHADLTPASDTWALGCLLYELLSGTQAFEAPTPAGVIAQVVTGRPRPLVAAAPAACRRVLDRALRPRAAERYPTAAALRDDLDRVLAGERVAPVRRAGAAWWRVPAAAAALALAGWAAWWAWRPAGSPPPQPVPQARSARGIAESLAAGAAKTVAVDPSEAARLYERAVAAAPAHPRASHWLVELGMCRWREGDGEAALAAWARVPRADPMAARAALLTAFEYIYRREHYLTGVWIARAAHGQGRAARLAQAAQLMLDERGPEALQRLRGEEGWEAALIRATLALEGEPPDYAAAEQEYSRALRTSPPLAWVRFNRALCRLRLGDARGAEADADEAARRWPTLSIAYGIRAEARIQLGRPAEARADVDRVIALAPDAQESWIRRGTVLLDAGDPASALPAIERALEIGPQTPDLWSLHGDALQGMGKLRESLASYDRALGLDDTATVPLHNRAAARLRLGDARGAIADWTRVLELQPDDWSAYHNRAFARSGLGESAAALADWDRALALKPDYADARLSRAQERMGRGDLDGALADVQFLVELRPDTPRPLSLRAEIRRRQRDFAGGLADIAAARKLEPTWARPCLIEGLLHEGQHDWAAAARAYRAYLQLAPDGDDAANARAWLAECEARLRRR